MEFILQLTTKDPEIIGFLEPLEPGEREERALMALKIGVIALKNSAGSIDIDAMRREGERISSEIAAILTDHTTKVTHGVGEELRHFLAPETGILSSSLERFASGALVARLSDHVNRLNTEMARQLSTTVGADSPMYKLLDPNQRSSVSARVEEIITRALEAQRVAVVREFSLDDKNSALSRLVAEVKGSNQDLTQQLSLDHPDSALSRMLRSLTEQLVKLTMDQQTFRLDVTDMLARIEARKKVEAEGAKHGFIFEDALLQHVLDMCVAAGDLFDATGTSTGLIRNCKKGDAVVIIGPDHVGAGRKVVYEAKEDASYNDSRAVAEIEEAMKNRGADIGVFVFSKKVAPAMVPLRRIGSAFLVVWDPEDPLTDVVLTAVHAAALALCARAQINDEAEDFDFSKIDTEVAEIEKQAARAAEVRQKCEAIRSAANNIEDTVRVSTEKIIASIMRLRAQITSLKEWDNG